MSDVINQSLHAQVGYWKEEARRYAQNADFHSAKVERLEARLDIRQDEDGSRHDEIDRLILEIGEMRRAHRAEVERLREEVLTWKGRALALMPYVPDETLIRTIQADAIRAVALLKEQSD
jgi:hypothetical protein